MGLDFVNLCGRKIDQVLYAGFFRDFSEPGNDGVHGWSDEDKPDIVMVIPLIVVGYLRKAIHDFGKDFDSVRRDACRTARAYKSEFLRYEIAITGDSYP